MRKGFLKKSHEKLLVSLCMPKIFSEFFPSMRNLSAMEGVRPLDNLVKFAV